MEYWCSFPLSTFRTIRTCYHQKHLLGFQLLQRSECMLIMYAYNTLLPVVAIFNTFMFKPLLSEMVEAIDLPKSLFHRSII